MEIWLAREDMPRVLPWPGNGSTHKYSYGLVMTLLLWAVTEIKPNADPWNFFGLIEIGLRSRNILKIWPRCQNIWEPPYLSKCPGVSQESQLMHLSQFKREAGYTFVPLDVSRVDEKPGRKQISATSLSKTSAPPCCYFRGLPLIYYCSLWVILSFQFVTIRASTCFSPHQVQKIESPSPRVWSHELGICNYSQLVWDMPHSV